MEIGDYVIPPGAERDLELPFANLPSGTQASLPVTVLCGNEPGPRLFLTAAIHGDELNGIEIIRRVFEQLDARQLQGTVVAVPIVNVHGFLMESRYLPDRRDLNRSFPGSKRGSLSSRLANLLMREVVRPSDYGVDLHTGSHGRTNLPQIRTDPSVDEAEVCARAFGAPVLVYAKQRDGSLRKAASRLGIPVLVYEAGEALRFDEPAIDAGMHGVLRLMNHLGMWHSAEPPGETPRVAEKTSWIRARRSGLLHLDVDIGDEVRRGQRIGTVMTPLGSERAVHKASFDGIVLGRVQTPVVSQGDGIVNMAKLSPV